MKNGINVALFLGEANISGAKALAARALGDFTLDNVFKKATEGLDEDMAHIVDNPVTRLGFVNGVVALARHTREPLMGSAAVCLLQSAYGTLAEAVGNKSKDVLELVTSVIKEDVNMPSGVENEALAVLMGLKAGNSAEVAFNEAKGGVVEISLPFDPDAPQKDADKKEVEEKPYRPKTLVELLPGEGKKMKLCPCCMVKHKGDVKKASKKQDKFKTTFPGTDSGAGNDWTGVLICVECSHEFRTEDEAKKKEKDAEYAAAEAKAKEAQAKAEAALRIEAVRTEIKNIEASEAYKTHQVALAGLRALALPNIDDLVKQTNEANATAKKHSELVSELTSLEASFGSKDSAVAEILNGIK